jgi:hypothetical protein
LAFVAYANFAFQQDNRILLAVQWYIVTFHCGAIWYHIRLRHHPAVGMAPGIFIPIALTIIRVRLESGWWYIMPVGTLLCALGAFLLCRVLVKAPQSLSSGEGGMDGGDHEETLLSHSSRSRSRTGSTE